MIVRIVKLEFSPENINSFLEVFKKQKEFIASFEGCTHLELLRDERNPNQFFTYSHWEDESYLEKYRESDFFKTIWAGVKPLFAGKPKAWSVKKVTV